MSEKKIKLYDELKVRFSNHRLDDKFDLDLQQFNSHDMIEFAGAVAQKTLELASKKAEFNYWNEDWVGVQSILDTIKQLE